MAALTVTKGLHHGDVYLHNTLVVCTASGDTADAGMHVNDVRLTDFGAAATAPDQLCSIWDPPNQNPAS
eukprot:6099338-Amphidinium_carterae.2